MKTKSTLITSALLGSLALSSAAMAEDRAALTDTGAYTVLAQAEAIEDYNTFFVDQIMGRHEELMSLLDADGNGMCSQQEFMQAHERIFHAVDANGDGNLSNAELNNAEQSLGKTAVN